MTVVTTRPAAMPPPHPTSSRRVLQCGFPKSGNYGVYRLLAAVLGAHGLHRSFKRRAGIARIAETLGADQLLFPEAAEVDAFSLSAGGARLELPHPACRWLPVDPALLLEGSTLLWTHDPCERALDPRLAAVTHRVYVVRDGRDVLESLAHHVVRPALRRLHPEYRHARAEAVLADLPLLASYARRWAAHVTGYLANREQFLLVRLEDLIREPEATVARVARALGLAVDAAALAPRLAFDALAPGARGHLRRGVVGGWRDAFGAAQRRIVDEVAGAALAALDYPPTGAEP